MSIIQFTTLKKQKNFQDKIEIIKTGEVNKIGNPQGDADFVFYVELI